MMSELWGVGCLWRVGGESGDFGLRCSDGRSQVANYKNLRRNNVIQVQVIFSLPAVSVRMTYFHRLIPADVNSIIYEFDGEYKVIDKMNLHGEN